MAVDLNKFLPVLRTSVLTIRFKMFDQFEFIRETSSNHQLINPILVIRPDFFSDNSAIVLVQGDLLNETVDLLTLGVVVNATFFVEDGFGSIFDTFGELLFVDEEFG